jgi:hypothetical protein
MTMAQVTPQTSQLAMGDVCMVQRMGFSRRLVLKEVRSIRPSNVLHFGQVVITA